MKPAFQLMAPPINVITAIARDKFWRGVWRVCYHNGGQSRISLELVATYEVEKELFHLENSSQVLDAPAFEAYRRQHWPMPHEKERNPDNVTLGVHSGSSPNRAKL